VVEPSVSHSVLDRLYKELAPRKEPSFVLGSVYSPPSYCSDVNF
jgi:hypothetical protein